MNNDIFYAGGFLFFVYLISKKQLQQSQPSQPPQPPGHCDIEPILKCDWNTFRDTSCKISESTTVTKNLDNSFTIPVPKQSDVDQACKSNAILTKNSYNNGGGVSAYLTFNGTGICSSNSTMKLFVSNDITTWNHKQVGIIFKLDENKIVGFAYDGQPPYSKAWYIDLVIYPDMINEHCYSCFVDGNFTNKIHYYIDGIEMAVLITDEGESFKDWATRWYLVASSHNNGGESCENYSVKLRNPKITSSQ